MHQKPVYNDRFTTQGASKYPITGHAVLCYQKKQTYTETVDHSNDLNPTKTEYAEKYIPGRGKICTLLTQEARFIPTQAITIVSRNRQHAHHEEKNIPNNQNQTAYTTGSN